MGPPPDEAGDEAAEEAVEEMSADKKHQPLEWWGGVEPTINRVGDRFFSQLQRSGHRDRLSDLDAFAALGLKQLRFPILWEEIAPEFAEPLRWAAIDAQLVHARALGLKPIAGLVHHGSGPLGTSLIDPQFPEKLAAYARQVAERYPWIESFTPVNEPLTTARFSGLYGHWYPHGQDGFTFARTMLNQCRGIVLAMRAIRTAIPGAKLVQTEDLAKTYASDELRYQADFENQRRWLTWDLLCGRVDREHPMWSYLLWLGAEEREIAFFEENPCPPQVIGVNHYVTSERFLDQNLRDHPPETHGGNGRHRYADVAAVRACPNGIAGPEALLREACIRYELPVAVTEAHLGCTREEQLRWLQEFWVAAQTLRSEGRDVCALTVWSLLGAFDWNSLLTREENKYEPGAFDLRGGSPRPTAIAQMIDSLAHGKDFAHPALATEGWWRRSIRLVAPVAERLRAGEGGCPPNIIAPIAVPARRRRGKGRPILITGGAGRLAKGFVRAAEHRGLAFSLADRSVLNITDTDSINEFLEAEKPWAVINCAGFSRVDEAEEEEESCVHSNVVGPELLGAACARRDIGLVTFSTDYVFDGAKTDAYSERDETCPLNVFGESKLLAEHKVLAAHARTLVVRPGKLFAADGEPDSLHDRLQTLAAGEPVRVANDIRFSASYLPDLVAATLDLLIDGERGVWHLANEGGVTPEEFIAAAANHTGLDADLIEAVPVWSLRYAALRPRNRTLRSERAQLLPPLEDALRRYAHESPPIGDEADRLLAIR